MRFDHLLCATAVLLFLSQLGASQSAPKSSSHFLVTFEPNRGQSSPEVKYIASNGSYRALISESSISYVIPGIQGDSRVIGTHRLQLRWSSDHRQAQFVPDGLQPGTSNYFLGADASRWMSKVPHYAELRENGVLPGIDLRYYSSAEGALEYDVIVSPGIDVSSVRLKVEGADRVRLCGDGALCLKVGGVEVRQLAPRASEMKGGRKVALDAAYVLKDGNEVSFAVRGHSPERQLIIDPVLKYASFMGGGSTDANIAPLSFGFGTAVDAAGNFYVTGQTNTTDFPVTPGAFMTSCPTAGGACVYGVADFVAKFSSKGELIYSTYLAGDPNGPESRVKPFQPVGKMIAVDSAGDAYIGLDAWTGFPTTEGAYQHTCANSNWGCAVIAELSPDGSELIHSTYFGGVSGTGEVYTELDGLVLGQNGDVYISGFTLDSSLPTTPGAYQRTCAMDTDQACRSGFVARFNLKNSGRASLVFSSFLGAAGGRSIATGIAVDRFGDAYVLGIASVDIPSIATFGSGLAPWEMCDRLWVPCQTFVAKLSGSDGHALRRATILRAASGSAIVVDSSLSVFVAGAATSGFATTGGAFQGGFAGGMDDGFITKLSPSGYFQLFSTFLGGRRDDSVKDMVVNNYGMPFVVGTTSSGNFPTMPGAFQRSRSSSTSFMSSAFVSALNADGGSLYYSSYLGGSDYTWGSGIALDAAWNAYVTGSTTDSDFPSKAGAFQKELAGNQDAFIAKVVIAGDLRASVTTRTSSIAKGGVVIYHARLSDHGPDGSDEVLFTDAIPAGMAYAGVYVPNGNGCTEPARGSTTGTLTCVKTRLEAGQTFYVNVYLRAVGTSGSLITNKVKVLSAQTQDLWPNNNSALATIRIQ